MFKYSHSNVHNSISGFVPCDRFADNTRQVHCGSEHGKNEVFSFPLFRLRLTRINVGKYLLTSCSIWDLRFASADASYIITKHNTICMKFLREFYFRELSGDSRKLNTAKIIFRQKKKIRKNLIHFFVLPYAV